VLPQDIGLAIKFIVAENISIESGVCYTRWCYFGVMMANYNE
jgi:hypothetical protein